MRNLKKVLALIVALVMAMSLAMTAGASAVFPDVDSSDDYAQAISLLKSLGVVGGDDLGNFNPDSTVTRAEFSKILFGLMNGDSDASLFSGPSVFTDVAEDSWYNGYINWASNLNIVNGKGDNKFAPKDSVTVQEATKMFIVALTGKSTLAWPYGFIAEAKKSNIDLYDGIASLTMASAAPRNIIAQLCKNAIFATDVASFYVYNGDGSIASRPCAGTAVFNLRSISSVIYETSFENYAMSGISAVDQMTVMNEDGTLVKATYSSDTIGNYSGYRGTVYYKDNTLGTANKLDAKDTVYNVVLDDCTVANALPLNVVSVSSTYQIQGITFDPTTDFDANGYFSIINGNGSLTAFPLNTSKVYETLATAYGDTSATIGMKAILGAFTTSSTATYGPAQDYNVKIVKDITTGKITAMYVVKNTPFAKVTTYSADAGILAVDNATAFSPTATTTAPSVLLASAGTAPNKTAVTVNGTFDTGDYVSIVPSRDFNGITYTVSPLLVNANATFTGMKSDGSAMFGDITYARNALVTTANVPTDYTDVLSAKNLGLKMNVYLDATSKNYIYAELVSATTATNYVFVKDFTTTTTMGIDTHTITVVDATNTTKTYTLASNCTSTAFLGAGYYGWKLDSVDQTPVGTTGKEDALIYRNVVTLTIDSDGNVSNIAAIVANPDSTAKKTDLDLDSDFSTFSDNNSVVATVDKDTVAYYYNTATSTLNIYTGNTLGGFTGATGYYTTAGTLKVKAILFKTPGSMLSSNVQYGAVSDYYAMAGTTLGKVRYDVTAVVGGSLTAELITADEDPATKPMGNLLFASKTYKQFVAFTFSTDGDTVIAMTNPTVASNLDMTDGAGFRAGIVTLASSNMYAIAGVEFPTNGTVAIKGAPKYFTTADATNFYLIPNTATAFNTNKAALSPMGKTPTLGVAGNLVPATNEVRYVVVFSASSTNVLKDVFIFQAVNIKPALTAPVVTLTSAPAAGSGKITATWPAVATATSYTVSYKNHADAAYTNVTGITALTYDITGLTNNTAYDVIVTAVNAELTLASTVGAATTAIGAATVPGTFTAASSAAGKLEIAWAANAADQVITKYVVSVTVGGVETLTDVTTGTVLNLTGLATGTYTVKVKAVNALGESAYATTPDVAVA